MRKFCLVLLLCVSITQIGFGQMADEFPTIHVEEWRKMNAEKSVTFDWFKDARFGMFIHWGLYSVPAGV